MVRSRMISYSGKVAGCILLLLLAMNVHAQQQRTVQPDTSAVPAAWEQLSEAYRTQPGHLLFMPLNRLNYSYLFLNKQNGNFKMAQEPEKQADYGMRTTGFVRLGRWIADGSFGYTRYRKDSTGMQLRSNIYDDNPFYLASMKKGNWDNEEYTLTGNLATTWGSKWQTGVGGRFKVGDYARDSDPRSEINNHFIQAFVSVGYKISERHNVQVHGSYGFGREGNSVDFQSLQNGAPGNPEYLIYTMIGYGYPWNSADKERQLYEFSRAWGWGGTYHGRFNAGELLLSGNYFVSEHRFRRENDRKDETINPNFYIGTYDKDGYQLDATFHTSLKRDKQWILMAGYRNDYGKNFADFILGNNYVFLKDTWKASVDHIRFKDGKLKWEAGFKWRYLQKQVVDGAMSTELFLRNHTAGMGYLRYLPLKKNGTQLLLGAEPGVSFDMGSSFDVKADTTVFTKRLLYPDYVYDSENQWQVKGMAGLQLRAGKKMLSVISFQVLYRQPFGEPVSPKPDLPVPGGNRIFYTLQLKFYH